MQVAWFPDSDDCPGRYPRPHTTTAVAHRVENAEVARLLARHRAAG
jgi:hypothetical protein